MWGCWHFCRVSVSVDVHFYRGVVRVWLAAYVLDYKAPGLIYSITHIPTQ